ncbi:phosphonate ABC transporter ATP-binding protein [Alkalihalophilus marmarensis]|uniref:phosphonate ABC transporter ATP-binding protein n=1 Tax=Alkalihalophilus marmarensis TaxID=521377 RepID=UPI002E1FA028|nr:phosphonate ABC transporter ATP-binding protein [Alkalihalophilus marmarensis]MED1599666.1 phosphonate ABC transporter ATP-binding protein [Alkalihalophilus marmarensis]
MLEISNLTVRYPKAKENALDQISLTMNRGEFICILGRSGAGKSTFIRCINRLIRPTSGSIRFDGRELVGLREKEMREIRAEMVMIFQHFNLIPRMSVYQNTLTGSFGGRPAYKNLLGLFNASEKAQADQALREVELDRFRDKRVEALSGGQKQRVGIARALMQKPSIILGDEPVASLDPTTSERIFNLLRQIHDERGLLTIINVHDVELAKKYATRIIGFKEGTLIFDNKPEALTNDVFAKIYK